MVTTPPRTPEKAPGPRPTRDRSHHTASLLDVSADPVGVVEFDILPPASYGRQTEPRAVRLPVHDVVVAVDGITTKTRAVRYSDACKAYGRHPATIVSHIRRCGAKLHRPVAGGHATWLTVGDFQRVLRQDFLPGKHFRAEQRGSLAATHGVPFGPARTMPVIQVAPGQYRVRVEDIALATGLTRSTVYNVLYRAGMTAAQTSNSEAPGVRDAGTAKTTWRADPLTLSWLWTLFHGRISPDYGVCPHKLLARREDWAVATNNWQYVYPGVVPVSSAKVAALPPVAEPVEPPPMDDPAPPVEDARQAPATDVPTSMPPEVRDEVLALLENIELGV